MYLPIVGLAAAMASARTISIPRPLALGAITVLVAAMATLSSLRLKVWSSSEALWTNAVLRQPNNGLVLMSMGKALEDLGRFDEAFQFYERAAVPGSDVRVQVLSNMAMLHTRPELTNLFDLNRALTLLNVALTESKDTKVQVFLRYNMARLELMRGNKELAREKLETLLKDIQQMGDFRFQHAGVLARRLLDEIK